MSNELKTVKVKHPTDGYAIINESDFDPKQHELYEPKSTTKAVENEGNDAGTAGKKTSSKKS